MTTEASILTIEVEGQRFTCTPEEWNSLDCIETREGEFHLLENGKSHLITVLQFDLATRSCLLKVDGEIKKVKMLRDLDLLIERMGLNAQQDKRLKTLHAPMPGLVSAIKVTPGQEVENGTPLLILEAMKMENVITSPQKGVIREIKIEKGLAVDKGEVLIEFE